jgi:hypothetical protein
MKKRDVAYIVVIALLAVTLVLELRTTSLRDADRNSGIQKIVAINVEHIKDSGTAQSYLQRLKHLRQENASNDVIEVYWHCMAHALDIGGGEAMSDKDRHNP